MSELESLREELMSMTNVIIDVYDDVLMGTVMKDRKVEDIIDRVLEYYKQWEPSESKPSSEIEVFVPTLLGTHGERPSFSKQFFDDSIVEQWVSGILHLSLYVDMIFPSCDGHSVKR